MNKIYMPGIEIWPVANAEPKMLGLFDGIESPTDWLAMVYTNETGGFDASAIAELFADHWRADRRLSDGNLLVLLSQRSGYPETKPKGQNRGQTTATDDQTNPTGRRRRP